MDEVYVLYVATDLYFVVGTHKNIKKSNKIDADTMYGNTSLAVTHKACVP